MNSPDYSQLETLPEYIKGIGIIPDRVMGEWVGIIPDNFPQELVTSMMQRHYKLKSIWLSNILLKNPLQKEQNITTQISTNLWMESSDFELELESSKPYAKQSQALLDLILGVWNHPSVQPKDDRKRWMHHIFLSPQELWFRCEVERCYEQITNWLGFVEPPQLIGKKKWADDSYKVLSD